MMTTLQFSRFCLASYRSCSFRAVSTMRALAGSVTAQGIFRCRSSPAISVRPVMQQAAPLRR